MVNRMELFINITDEVYSPRGFITLPEYSHLFESMSDTDKERVLVGFVRYLAVTMRKMLKSSIKTQYYASSWDPLSASYLKFKQEHGLSENIWEATGKLVDSISYYRHGDRYVIGIKDSAKYPNGTSVLYVAKCMEFGTKNMPARPLFAPVLRYIRRHIRTYWEMYLINPNQYLGSRLSDKIKKSRRKK